MFVNGQLVVVVPNEFSGKDGEKVEFYVNYLKMLDADGTPQVLVVNSKEDFSDAVGKVGVFALRLFAPPDLVDRSGKIVKNVYKISLVGYKQE